MKKDDTVITNIGISVFDDDDLEIAADPMAKTLMTGGDEHLGLDGSGGGSGLLDLTRESDDTSLGAELLEGIDMGDTAETLAQSVQQDSSQHEPPMPVEGAAAGCAGRARCMMPVVDGSRRAAEPDVHRPADRGGDRAGPCGRDGHRDQPGHVAQLSGRCWATCSRVPDRDDCGRRRVRADRVPGRAFGPEGSAPAEAGQGEEGQGTEGKEGQGEEGRCRRGAPKGKAKPGAEQGKRSASGSVEGSKAKRVPAYAKRSGAGYGKPMEERRRVVAAADRCSRADARSFSTIAFSADGE